MNIFKIFRLKKETNLSAACGENSSGNWRITDGVIIDSEPSGGGEIVHFIYSVYGADYESSQILTEEQLLEPLKYSPGAKIGVRYNVKHHGNSILI